MTCYTNYSCISTACACGIPFIVRTCFCSITPSCSPSSIDSFPTRFTPSEFLIKSPISCMSFSDPL